MCYFHGPANGAPREVARDAPVGRPVDNKLLVWFLKNYPNLVFYND